MPFRPSSREPLGEPELFTCAVGALARRMRSERDLRRLLAARAEPGPAGAEQIDRIVVRLRELRYLSDERFAADFARLRRDNRSHGARRVRQDLTSRGIGKDLAEEAVHETHGEPADELALARTFVERKRLARPAGQKETVRFVGRLLRNGFASSTAWALLREWSIDADHLGLEDDSAGEASDASPETGGSTTF